MKKPILRGYYGGIFFEFVLQDRTADAIIILPGFPSGNDFWDLIAFFYGKGYHVFVPRYRGTYQSTGVFLSKNPVDDMLFFLENLDGGYAKNMWDMKKEGFKINKKILVSGSFGGPIALALAAKCKKISHLILQAPVWDFKIHNSLGDEQDFEKMTEFVRSAYKNCYRFRFKSLMKKLGKFDELNPAYYLPKVKDIPILIMHDPNDRVVSLRHTKEKIAFLERGTYLEHYLGHKITSDIFSVYWKDIDKFIKINYVN
ncbi:alpha/beta fold hydrolase [Candidatus Pacearchaeota archaeon]|nr:alpha/beta fold hydrolase [Candidatus Pacearchaeota archaeon]